MRIMLVPAVAVAIALVIGNLAILLTSAVMRETTSITRVRSVSGVKNLVALDSRVWRGSAPTRDGYKALAERGVRTVIDLRAEAHLRDDKAFLGDLGVELVRIPVRDGQIPSEEQVARFLEVTRGSPGLVFVHCGAGVGRTGSMSAAYQVASGEVRSGQALRRTLAVGPPSLEQLVFVAGLAGDEYDRPGVTVRTVSRVLDAPRRLWSRYGL